MDKNRVINLLKSLKDDFNISNFILFGSVATDSYKDGSDVDVAYILKDGYKLSFDNYLNLEKLLSNTLEAKIDLMNFKKINPLVKLHAKKDFIYV